MIRCHSDGPTFINNLTFLSWSFQCLSLVCIFNAFAIKYLGEFPLVLPTWCSVGLFFFWGWGSAKLVPPSLGVEFFLLWLYWKYIQCLWYDISSFSAHNSKITHFHSVPKLPPTSLQGFLINASLTLTEWANPSALPSRPDTLFSAWPFLLTKFSTEIFIWIIEYFTSRIILVWLFFQISISFVNSVIISCIDFLIL